MTETWTRAKQRDIFHSRTPHPLTVPQGKDVGYPILPNTKDSDPYYITGVLRRKKMAQMKGQIKAPEKIQLNDEEIANLSDAQFKTLVIRMLTEMFEYGQKIEGEVKAMQSKNKGKCTGDQ